MGVGSWDAVSPSCQAYSVTLIPTTAVNYSALGNPSGSRLSRAAITHCHSWARSVMSLPACKRIWREVLQLDRANVKFDSIISPLVSAHQPKRQPHYSTRQKHRYHRDGQGDLKDLHFCSLKHQSIGRADGFWLLSMRILPLWRYQNSRVSRSFRDLGSLHRTLFGSA